MPPQIYYIDVLPLRDHPFPLLIETIPLHSGFWQPPKQVQTDLHVTVKQPDQPKGRRTAVARSHDRFRRDILTHEESKNVKRKKMDYTKTYRYLQIRKQNKQKTSN